MHNIRDTVTSSMTPVVIQDVRKKCMQSKQMILLLHFHHLGVDSCFEVQWCILEISVSSPVLHWTVKWLKRCGNDFICGVPISFHPFGFQVLMSIYIAVRNNTAILAVDAVLEQRQQCSPSPFMTKSNWKC